MSNNTLIYESTDNMDIAINLDYVTHAFPDDEGTTRVYIHNLEGDGYILINVPFDEFYKDMVHIQE